MYTIKENLTKNTIIKKSKFIAKVFFIQDVDQALDILNQLKNEYKDATHICFCYICDNNIKFSDDNEPSNTAGMPIYNVLKNNNLNHVLAVVIRYFGGIKLGSGGLIRAYSNSVSETIKDNITKLQNGFLIKIEFNYEKTKEIEYILKEFIIINKEYKSNVVIQFICNDKKLNNLKNLLKNKIIRFEIEKEIITKK